MLQGRHSISNLWGGQSVSKVFAAQGGWPPGEVVRGPPKNFFFIYLS